MKDVPNKFVPFTASGGIAFKAFYQCGLICSLSRWWGCGGPECDDKSDWCASLHKSAWFERSIKKNRLAKTVSVYDLYTDLDIE